MAGKMGFTEEDTAVDNVLGYPKAYANLCRNLHLYGAYTRGPPFTYYPYSLHAQDVLRLGELEQLFPFVESEKEVSKNSRYYGNILWKQLNHLGNAGFDPEKFRVDPYGNVLYIHADSGSPLAWEIDHWFPCSRGGITVPSNLRILQWQVFEKKHNKLEFLVPWWDLQLGISVNQFLSIFASSNSDFRNRAFSWLFLGGKNEELNDLQDVESHCFPQHFVEAQDKIGPAPAAIVFSRRSMDTSALKPIDFNRYPRSNSPTIGLRKFSVEEDESLSKAIQQFTGSSPSISNSNENCYSGSNQYLAIAEARDSLRQRQLTVKKLSDIKNLDDEVNELKEKNEVERLGLQDLELKLIKSKRKAEKCRRLAEAQSTYKASLEKMILDAMHQSVVYKEQIRLTHTANSTLMARLEAQKAICESAKNELRRRLQHREEIENQIKPYSEQARKRSRIDDNQWKDNSDVTLHLLQGTTMQKPLQKELRLFLEEDNTKAKAGASLVILKEKEQGKKDRINSAEERQRLEEVRLDEELQKLVIEDRKHKRANEIYKSKSVLQSPRIEDDEEYRMKIGKGYAEKWLQMLLENVQEESTSATSSSNPNQNEMKKTDEMIQKLNHKNPQQKIKILALKTPEQKVEARQDSLEGGKKLGMEKKDGAQKVSARRKSFEAEPKEEKNGKGKGHVRSESARALRPIPSSPSVILEMRKRVDCIGRKPLVIEDEDNEENNINQSTMSIKSVKTSIKACTKAIKSAVKK